MSKLIIIHTVIPDYRKRLFQYLSDHLGDKFEVYAGSIHASSGFKKAVIPNQKRVRNYYLFGKRLLFQTGFWNLLLSNHIIVLEINPRYITSWFFLLIRRIFNKKTIVWGHAWPRKGKHSSTDIVRGLQRKLATAIITYSEKQRDELLIADHKKPIVAAPNALYNANEITMASDKERHNILYVGRIIEEKRVALIIEAFMTILEKIPNLTKLVLIGDGPRREGLLEKVKKAGLEDRIELPGHINDLETLRQYYSQALLTVNGGTAGLSIIQSLGFGVPVILPENAAHGPEVEAIKIGFNGLHFEAESSISLAQAIQTVFDARELWLSRGHRIHKETVENYTIDKMGEVFLNLAAMYGV